MRKYTGSGGIQLINTFHAFNVVRRAFFPFSWLLLTLHLLIRLFCVLVISLAEVPAFLDSALVAIVSIVTIEFYATFDLLALG